MTAKLNKHPSKVIEQAIKEAESQGWRYIKPGGSSHSWGRLLCPYEARGGCGMSVYSTPRDDDNHAKQIQKRIGKCKCNDKQRGL